MKKTTFPRRLLLPLVPAYRLALLLREVGLRTGLEPVWRLRFPVVSIGSLSAGGAGKTPLTIALAKALDRRGLRVDVLSRGYGRALSNPAQRAARVAPDGTAEEFGDEPLLIARETGVPVYVAAERYDAGLLAEAEAPEGSSTVHLLDDGFQHRQLHRDVDILLLDHCDWLDGLLPAGNLREPMRAARRATVIAVPAGNPEFEAALRGWGWQGPVWRLHRKMEVPAPPGHEAGSVLAFCGIARPEQFFAGLEAAGLKIVVRLAFPDHHRYTTADLKRLIAVARNAGAAALITTEKDQVRLGKLSASFPESLPLKTARLRVEIEKQEEALDWLVERIGQPATVNTSGRLLRK
jgi:tetraacyldisaccharide 4'-kinase